VPEHALAVNPGGVIGEHTERRFDLGAAGAAVDAQGHRQGRGQRVAVPHSWAVSISQWRHSRSPRRSGSGGGGGGESGGGGAQAIGVVEVEQAGAGAEGMDLGQRLGPSNGLRGLFMEPPR
jgi:hypothetical protein